MFWDGRNDDDDDDDDDDDNDYDDNPNKHQSNLAKRGIAFHFYSPGGSSNLQVHVLAVGFDPQISPSPGGQGQWHNMSLDPTSVRAKRHLNPSRD